MIATHRMLSSGPHRILENLDSKAHRTRRRNRNLFRLNQLIQDQAKIVKISIVLETTSMVVDKAMGVFKIAMSVCTSSRVNHSLGLTLRCFLRNDERA